MVAALTVAVLLMLSVMIVRIATVVMRLTGVHQNIARFQCISALTGTGFTTRESEMIVNYPIRRKTLAVLMILGNLGLVSVASTFIVAFIETSGDTDATVNQLIAFMAAIGLIIVLMTNKTLDRAMCHLAGNVLRKTTSLGKRRFQRMLQVGDGFSIAEHVYAGKDAVNFGALSSGAKQLSFLAIRGTGSQQSAPFQNITLVSPGDILICYGSDTDHEAFEDGLLRLA